MILNFEIDRTVSGRSWRQGFERRYYLYIYIYTISIFLFLLHEWREPTAGFRSARFGMHICQGWSAFGLQRLVCSSQHLKATFYIQPKHFIVFLTSFIRWVCVRKGKGTILCVCVCVCAFICVRMIMIESLGIGSCDLI